MSHVHRNFDLRAQALQLCSAYVTNPLSACEALHQLRISCHQSQASRVYPATKAEGV